MDLHTLVFALTDENHDLVRACAAFGDQWKKVDVTYGRITKRLLRYAREDVRHTAVMYRNCMAELRRHEDAPLVPYALYSPATVGTEYLKAMGVQPPMEKYDLDERIYGWSMAAFFGGRAEARIVRTPIPVTLVDAASMYPTVNALLGTWRLMVAERIDTVDATDAVRDRLADRHVVDRCFDRSFWHDEIGVTLVELASAEGDILPVRAYWDPEAALPVESSAAPVGTMWAVGGISRSSSSACAMPERSGSSWAAPVSEQTRGLRIPKLFMAGEVDGEAGDLLRVFEETAPEPKEVVTLDTGEHGTDILAYADVAVADEFRQAVLDFLARI